MAATQKLVNLGNRTAMATLFLVAMGASSQVQAATLSATPACSGNSLNLNVSGDGPFEFRWSQDGIPYSATASFGLLYSASPATFSQVRITELSGDGESLNVGDWSCPTSAPLSVGRTCVDDDLQLSASGDGPFSVAGSGPNLPVSNFDPTVTLTGPGTWTNVSVSEGSGDFETAGQGNWICPMTSLSVTPTCVGNDLQLSLSGDGTMEIQGVGPGFPGAAQSLWSGPGTVTLPGPGYWGQLRVREHFNDREIADLGSLGCGSPSPLATSVSCQGEHLYLSLSGDGPFDYQWYFSAGPPLYTASTYGSTLFYGPTPGGPNSWYDLTVTEATGDHQSRNLGTFTCPGIIGGCAATPLSGCKAADSQKSVLTVRRDASDGSKSQLTWKSKGAATDLLELADPLSVTEYRVCLYDSNGVLLEMPIAAGGTCDTKPCWKATAKGFKYQNKATTPEGVSDFLANSGAAGKAMIKVAARGSNLDLPGLPLSTPITAQVSNGATCWEATFTTPTTNPLSTTKWAAKND